MQQIASFISVMLYICCLYIFGVLRVQILTMEPKECARWRWNVHQVTEQPSSSHMQPAITMVHPSKMDRSQKSSFTLRYDRRMNQKQNNGCVIQLTDTPNPADDSLANLFNYLVRTFFHFFFFHFSCQIPAVYWVREIGVYKNNGYVCAFGYYLDNLGRGRSHKSERSWT